MLGSAFGNGLDANKVAKDVGSRPDGTCPIDLERCKKRPARGLSDGQLEAIGRGWLYLESKGVGSLTMILNCF